MSEITSTDFIIRLIVNIIQHFQPSQRVNHNQNQTSSNNIQIQRNQPRRRRTHRNRNHYSQFNLQNNYRGCIILRARQITQQNRLLSAQAEQALIEAILQARTEHHFFARHLVPRVHTVNERPQRPSGNPEPETNSTNYTEPV